MLLKTNTFTYSKSIFLMRNEHKMYFLHYGIAACAAANTLPCPCFQGGQIRGLRNHMTQENTGAKKNTCWAKTICESPKTPPPNLYIPNSSYKREILFCTVGSKMYTHTFMMLYVGGKIFSRVQSCTKPLDITTPNNSKRFKK